MNVSFLGLGAIGTPMATHLSRAYNLTVWNRTASKADAFSVAHAARVARTPRDAARDADVFITCFPTSVEVETVLFGPESAADALAPGSIVMDCTSGDPATSRIIAERLAGRDIAFLDAPVSGGVVGAEKGALTVMCGGGAATLERLRGILETFAAKIVLCGPVGSGDAVKAVNNALLAVHIWSTAEGLAMLSKLGVEAAVALDVINASSGRSNTSMNLFPERVVTRAFPRTFRLALLEKDAGIAAAIARETR
ncbi:MAG: NAD(P)-dependent oxidoreductase, partial [Gemmatimonadaceae bacterium]